MPRPLAVTLLIITTMLWGFAFVAQKSAMGAMGPLTFSAVRYLLGSLAILPLVFWELKRTGARLERKEWGVVAIIAISFFLGVTLQQIGLTVTTVTNGGFLTSLYVLFVPLLALVVFWLVKGLNKMAELGKKKEEEAAAAEPPAPPAPSAEEVLLTEIRDLLKNK